MMPKSGKGATACLKMWAGSPDVQNKNVLFLHAGLNISSQIEGTNAHRPPGETGRTSSACLQPRNVFP